MSAQNSIRNWAELGIAWVLDTVSEQVGPNASNRISLGDCQILVITDGEKFVKAHGWDLTVALVNKSNSIRVGCQAIGRKMLSVENRKGYDVEANRERCYAWLKGHRAAATPTVREVNVYKLMDGSEYRGNDLVELQQATLASGVAVGLDFETAQRIAEATKL